MPDSTVGKRIWTGIRKFALESRSPTTIRKFEEHLCDCSSSLAIKSFAQPRMAPNWSINVPAQEVDVAFVDFDMPVMDGLAAAAEVTKRGIPVVLLSGHPDAQDIVLEHEPVVARLLKPATVAELQNVIAFALSSRR